LKVSAWATVLLLLASVASKKATNVSEVK